MANLSLSAVSVGVYAALNVTSVVSLVQTTDGVDLRPRIYDDIPRKPTYPLVLYSVHAVEARGMGTTELTEIDLRVTVFSKTATGLEAQTIIAAVQDALKDASLTVSGYRMAGRVVWRETVKLGTTTEIHGEKVNEWVVLFTLWLEASA